VIPGIPTRPFPSGLAVLLGWLAPLALHGQQPMVELNVVDSLTRAPIGHVEYVAAGSGLRGQSDARGHGHLFLRPGVQDLALHRLGYVPRSVRIQVFRDTAITVALLPDPRLLKEHVVHSSSAPGATGSATATVTVLDREYLDRNQHSTFSQGLERIAGLNSITTGVGIAKPVIRGMQGNRIAVNDHGVRQEGQQWGSDHGLEIDPFGVERVEVLRGAASLMYGPDALGGVINVLPGPVAPKGSLRGSVVGVFRNNNDHVGGSAQVEARPGKAFFGVRATWQDYGDYRVPADTFVYNRFVLPIDGRRLKNTAGRERHVSAHAGLVTAKGVMRLTLSRYEQATGLFPGAVGIPRAYSVAHDGDRRNVEVPAQFVTHSKAMLNIIRQVGSARIEADLGLQYNERREESFPHAHNQGPRPDGTLAHGLDLLTGTAHVRAHRGHGERWRTVSGFNGLVQRNQRSGYEFILGDHLSAMGGVYTVATYQARPTLTWQFGARMDAARVRIDPYFQTVYTSPTEPIGTVQRGPSADRTLAAPSGAVGFAWQAHEHWTLKANAGRGVRFPTAPELGMNGVHHGTFRHEQGDSTLRTEAGWQLDLALVHARKRVSFTLSPFAYLFDNYIYLRPTAIFSPLPEAGQLYRYTQSSMFQTGGEVEMLWRPAPHWLLRSAVEYVWNQNLDNGAALPFTPPLLLRNELTWNRHMTKGRELSLALEHVASAAQLRTDVNEPGTPGYQLLNATAGFSQPLGSGRLDLLVQVRNLFDSPYLLHLSRYRILNLPEPGRNVMLSLRYTFSGKDRSAP
jgi:iron complex outermembrane receptor protein